MGKTIWYWIGKRHDEWSSSAVIQTTQTWLGRRWKALCFNAAITNKLHNQQCSQEMLVNWSAKEHSPTCWHHAASINAIELEVFQEKRATISYHIGSVLGFRWVGREMAEESSSRYSSCTWKVVAADTQHEARYTTPRFSRLHTALCCPDGFLKPCSRRTFWFFIV